ncbi:MAG: DinB family protein [Chitinophagales bacterium]|jgi:hypothetical protein|nr:DinB family protein [Bacteroidota bacterium]MBP8917475.1 DinB family protein [Chitinophagales bacterium]MBP9221241.1 DinB family protein [Chitinophagales bacterium]MBP9795624.1 DinB family protein [Chitinophagales bacterium]
MTKIEVTSKLKDAIANYENFCLKMVEMDYFASYGDKWSVSENTRHLMLAISPIILAFSLPKFLLRLFFGKPNRNSRSFDELLAKYIGKLEAGGKASKPYVPNTQKVDVTKETELKKFMILHNRLISKMERWKDVDLDRYLLPHPLLGKITLREMLYFTTFHIQHHQQTIENLQKPKYVQA